MSKHYLEQKIHGLFNDGIISKIGEHEVIRCIREVEDARKGPRDVMIGDLVEVINPGRAYSSYSSWVAKNVMDKELIAKYRYGSRATRGTRGVVVAIAPHSDLCSSEGYLFYINTKYNGCFLIGAYGVRLCSENGGDRS